MGFNAAVGYAFRHRVRLTPNNILPQVVTDATERKRQLPGYADKVFSLVAVGHQVISGHSQGAFIGSLLVAARVIRVFACAFAAAGVAVADIKPQCAGGFKHAQHFGENFRKPGYVGFGRIF